MNSFARHAPTAATTANRDVREYVFGFGRRVCPGRQVPRASGFAGQSYSNPRRQLAEATLYFLISNFLATMVATKKIGTDGKPIIPVVDYRGAATVYVPHIRRCSISLIFITLQISHNV